MDIGDAERGGICTLYKNLALELTALDYEVHVITARAGWNPPDIQMHQIDLSSLNNASETFTTLEIVENPDLLAAYSIRVAEVIRDLTLDIVECSTWGYELLAYLRQPQKRSTVIVRGDLSAVTVGAISHGSCERELLDRADAKVFNSAFAKFDLEHHYGEQLGDIIHLGVDEAFFFSQPHLPFSSGYLVRASPKTRVSLSSHNLVLPMDKIKVAWVGKPTIMKGFDLFLEVVDSAPDDLYFIACIGQSIQHFLLEDYPNVVFLQDLPRNDYIRLLQQADVFLSTSRWEGFCLAALEAMAAGQPIVFPAACPVFGEYVRDGVDGYTYKHLLDVHQKLRAAALNKKMHCSSQNRARQFTWKKTAKQTSRLYQQFYTAHY